MPIDFWHRDHLLDDWWGLRQLLAPQGISIGTNLVLDGFDNFLGGRRTGQTGGSTFDLGVDVDTQNLMDLTDGEFYIDLEDHAGGNPSRALVGDLQVFDKLSFHPYLQIFELWYQQKFFSGRLRIKIGKTDANKDFAVVSNGQVFLNSGPTGAYAVRTAYDARADGWDQRILSAKPADVRGLRPL